MPKQTLYLTIKNLQSKGLVTATLEHPAKFSAVPFEKVLDLFIKAKTEEAQRIKQDKKNLLLDWQSIAITEASDQPPKFTVIEGRNYIYPRLRQMIEETQNQLLIISTVSGLMRAEQFGLLDAAFSNASKTKTKVKFITELSEDNWRAMKHLLGRRPKAGFSFEGRTPELGLKLISRMLIRDDAEAAFFISQEKDKTAMEADDACLWTNSRTIINSFKAVFEDLWQSSTDIEKRIAEIETGKPTTKTCVISDPVTAKKKYDETIDAAKGEIVMLTSSEGLSETWKNITQLKEEAEKGVSVKIMAPITRDNLEFALQLSACCKVKHVPTSYLRTTIVDGKHLFQFRTSPDDQKKQQATVNFENTVYTTDPEQVKRAKIILGNIWKSASFLSAVMLKSILSPTEPIVSSESVSAFTEFMKKAPANALPMGRATVGTATVYPPSNLNMPVMRIQVVHYEKESLYGEGNTLIIYLRLKTQGGYAFIPVAGLETNPKVVALQKMFFAGTPAATNPTHLVRPDQLQVRKHGNTLFAGWTVQIPLPPTTHFLPPSCILFEAYGKTRHNIKSEPVPSGHIITWEADSLDAFIAFLDPAWKYAGPGTQGVISTNAIATLRQPGINKESHNIST